MEQKHKNNNYRSAWANRLRNAAKTVLKKKYLVEAHRAKIEDEQLGSELL